LDVDDYLSLPKVHFELRYLLLQPLDFSGGGIPFGLSSSRLGRQGDRVALVPCLAPAMNCRPLHALPTEKRADRTILTGRGELLHLAQDT